MFRQCCAERADFLPGDLARDAAIEQQHDERDLVGLGRAGNFLRRHARTEGQPIDAVRKKQQLEDREPELIGIVGWSGEQDLPRVARRTDEPRHVAQEPLREIGKTKLLEILHLATDDALMHRFI